MTIKQLKRVFTSELRHLYPQTEIDSFFYMLFDYFFNLKRVDIALMINDKIDIPQDFHTALNNLVNQKPIQYILNKTEFYGLEFNVNEHVLIPRPETEELVDWIITDLNNNNNNKSIQIIDIGTGSGCIAVSLSKNIKNAQITALDISSKAIKVAKENAFINNVDINFIIDNILELKTTIIEKFDVIVSNPPYIRLLEKAEIQDNVLLNEPHLALFVENNNPLIFYKAIAEFALNHINNKGAIYFEINQYLGNETVNLLKNLGFNNIILKKDIFNNNRMIKATL